MVANPVHAEQELYAPEQPVSLSHIVHTLRRYAGVIVIALAAVVLLYLIIATVWWLRAPSQRVTAMPFRLEFKGASIGEYPSGVKFSVADITATPVLLDVFNSNNLSRFMPFDQFARSVIVLESNPAMERLTAEYQVKLADPRLTPVDRERLERDFESRRISISKSDYSIQLVPPDQARPIPPSIRAKVLHNMLGTWARKAAIEKRVLDYNVSVLSKNVLSQVRVTENNYLVPLLVLRRRLDDLRENTKEVAAIPGALLVRTSKDRISAAELQLRVEEIIRFRVEPLMAMARSQGFVGSPTGALEILRAQLAHDQQALEGVRRREEALRSVLTAYESPKPEAARPTLSLPEAARNNRSTAPETLMPQLTDSFLDRIVALSNRSADVDYRQDLTDEIKEASLNIIPAELAVRYDQELIDIFQRRPPPPKPAIAAEVIRAEWDTVMKEVHQTIDDVNEIYVLASRQLYPETELYRTLGPAVTRTQRAVSPIRLMMFGVLTLLIALPVIIVGALLHNRVREEEAMELAAGSPSS